MAKPVYRQVQRFIMPRDLDVLNFLWRWKIASSQALAKKFFLGVRPESAHLRLKQLEEVGYLECIQIGKRQFAWGLGKRGYEYIRHHFSEDYHQGFRSEY